MSPNNNDDAVLRFYAAAAPDYDAVFDTDPAEPERAADLDEVRERVAELVRARAVLELACGTGAWTGVLAGAADRVLATDAVEPMLAQARARALPEGRVAFRRVDAKRLPDELPGDAGRFDAVFIGGWWSHLTRDEQDAFLPRLRARVGKDVLLVLVDDEYVEGVSPPVARTDAQGNTFQRLAGPDGAQVELPKNYPSDSALRKRLGGAAKEIRIERWGHYWLLTCRLK